MTAPYLFGGAYSYNNDEIMSYDGFYIDPSLHSPSPSTSFFSQWAPPVQEFLKDKQRTAIFNAEVSNATQNRHYYLRPTVGIPIVPKPTTDRFASPISSIEPSSASGTARSPPADTESYSDHPSTPPELFSPYSRPAQHDHWNAHAHALQFEIMGPQGCVNPVEVNPSQQPDVSESDSDNFHFDFSARTISWDRYSSQCEVESASYPANSATTDFQAKRMASPDDITPPVKDEVTVASQYPPPPAADLDMESDEDAAAIQRPPKRRMEDDGDWKPPKKIRGNNTRSPPRPRQRARPVPQQESPTHRKGGRPNPDVLQRPQQSLPQSTRPLPPSRAANKSQLICNELGCQKLPFADQSSLDQHIKKKHTRPYICVFHFAGCESTFASKNEWKRHVASQHLLLNYWLCQEDECAKTCNGTQPIPTNSNAAKSTALPSHHQHQRSKSIASGNKDKKKIPNGNIFNRKDLYTQHMRRMHMPENVKKKLPVSGNKKTLSTSGSSAAVVQEWEDALRRFQDKAIRARCALPEFMTCPAEDCSTEFRGAEAWDQRMEHVARHLDRAAQGGEVKVEFGGEGDACLTEWAGSAEVGIIELAGGMWVLKNGASQGGPGRGRGGGERMVRRERGRVEDEIVVGSEDDERDAEGDMDDDV